MASPGQPSARWRQFVNERPIAVRGVMRFVLEDGLITRMIDKGKVKINQDMIRRLIDAYRG